MMRSSRPEQLQKTIWVWTVGGWVGKGMCLRLRQAWHVAFSQTKKRAPRSADILPNFAGTRERAAARDALARQRFTSPARIRCLHEFRRRLSHDPHDSPPPLDGTFLCHRPCIL